LATKTFRTQTDPSESRLLAQTVSDPVYNVGIQDLHKLLRETGKKISLFFALHAFDRMSTDERSEILSHIAQLQSQGDHIVIMLDEKPDLEATIQQIENKYPGFIALPFLPPSTAPAALHFVLVPAKDANKRTIKEIEDLIYEGAMALFFKGRQSEEQTRLHLLQKEKKLQVVCLEDFYIQQVREALAQAGYESSFRRPIMFECRKPPEDLVLPEELMFRSVSDTLPIRQWALRDPVLKEWLQKKGQEIPSVLLANAHTIKAQGLKILAAEVLVIEATKK
jgi:hypothetical protein